MAGFAWKRIAASLCLGLVISLADAEEHTSPMNTVCFDTSDRVRLCYAEQALADKSKPLLVFIPGWTMPASIWSKQLAFFSGRYPLVAFDPRGQGKSDVPGFGYTLERRVQDIHELLERFPEHTCVLIGWSLAALETLAYVDRYGSGRLGGLILVDSSIGEGPGDSSGKSNNPFFASLRMQREQTLRNFVTDIFHTRVDAGLKAQVLASALKTDVEDSIRLLSYGMPRSYWKEAVYRYSGPVLYLVTPRYDPQASLLARKHPQATTQIFKHAGHALFWDEADQFNQSVQAFVAGLNILPAEHR